MDLRRLTDTEIKENDYWINLFEKKHFYKFSEPSYKSVPFVSKFFSDKKDRKIFCLKLNIIFWLAE